MNEKTIKRIRILSAALSVLCFAAAGAGAQETLSYNTTLRRNLGAAAIGMGGACTTITDDIDTLFYNPAGLSGLKRTEFAVSYLAGSPDEYVGSFACCIPVSTGAFSWTFAAGAVSRSLPGKQQDHINTIASGRRVSKTIDIGLGVKTIQSSLEETASAAAGAALDLGVIYNFPRAEKKKSQSKIGLSIQDLGAAANYTDRQETPVNKIRFGWSNEATVSNYTGNTYNTVTAIDLVKFSDNNYIETNVGFGFKFTEYFTLRMGISVYAGTSAGNFGLGFNIPWKGRNIQVDYVSITSRLETTYMLGVRIKI